MEIPHCPNHKCDNFEAQTHQNWYIHYGFHETKAFGPVPRFRCKCCNKTFSTQTFSIDYYAKKVINYETLLSQLVTASGLIDMSRNLKVRVESIQNRFERLCRCTLGIHADLLGLLPMVEDMAADGFESFSYSQYFPNHVNLFAGSDSEFIYALGFANLRRKGRMTEEQKEKRKRLEACAKAKPKAIETSFLNLCRDLLQRLTAKGITGKTLFTDEHRAYPRAFSRVKGFLQLFDHKQISSKAPRTRDNPLFPVNYVDRQLRKDLSDHCRETVQFAHCPSALMARASVYRFYHNCVIPRRVKQHRLGNEETHAEEAGIPRAKLDEVIKHYTGKRVFFHKILLGLEEQKTWFLEWRNPGRILGRYVPKYIRI